MNPKISNFSFRSILINLQIFIIYYLTVETPYFFFSWKLIAKSHKIAKPYQTERINPANGFARPAGAVL